MRPDTLTPTDAPATLDDLLAELRQLRAVLARDRAELLTAAGVGTMLGIGRAQVWKLHASGKLPLPVYLGSKAPRWRASELRDWIQAGAPDRQTWEKQGR